MEEHDVYLKDIAADLVATAKASANTGNPGLSLHANFSEGNRAEAREEGVRLNVGGFIGERTAGNDLFGPLLP